MMKKALSIVLSVLMILSACVVAFALEGDNKIPALTVNIYTHGSGSSAVSLYYGDSTYRGTSIREYSPGNEDITVNVYTPFRDQVTDAVLSGLITGTEVPAGYGSLMTGAESVSGIKNFVGAAVCQDDIPVDGSVVAVKLSDIKTIADTAAKNAARAAAQGFVDALNAGDIEILSSSVGTPTVTAKYGGYATDNAFIATYKPSVTETVSVWVNTSAGDYTIQSFIDLENKKLILNGDVLSMLASNVTGPAVRSMFSGLGMPIDSSNSADITKLLKDSAYDAAKDAVTVVFDHLSALAEAKAAAKAELAAYKSAEDYRAAEREDLSAAIAAGSAAIAAAADVEAVAAALADAKAALDAIKTDAQLTAEELAADKAAFDAYKFNLTAAVQAMAQAGDSDAAARIIADAASDVALLDYDETKTLDENKAAADAIADIADALAAQRAADEVEALIAAIGTPVYTPECDAKIAAARTAYDKLTAAGKALVTNYADLTAAETDFAALQAQNDTGKALQLKTNGLAANLYGKQNSNIWFGNYMQSSADSKEPVKWRVLSNADGKLFLLSDQNLDVVRYNEEETAVTWETCTLRKWLNGYDGNPHSDSFIVSAISDKEAAAIAETKVANDNNPSYNIPGGNDTTDKVFLVSIAEATNTAYGFTDNIDSTITRVSTNTEYVHSGGHTGGIMFEAGKADMWRLRTPGEKAVRASHVNTDGFLNDNGFSVFDRSTAVRPALNVDLNAVLFTSAAVNGKVGDGALTEIAANDAANKDWKLTLLDESRAFAVTETAVTVTPGDTVTLTYTGATVGTDEYISAIVADENGDAVYYGRLATPTDAAGTLTVTVPADLALGSYTLKVFSEQYNGDYKTDYASAFSDVTLTVISELDAAKAAAKEELAKYKNADDYRAAEQADLAAAISDGKDAIDGAGDINAVTAALNNAKADIDAIKTDAQLTAEELAAAKETLAGEIGTAREFYDSIKDDYPVIADDLDTKLQQAEGVLGNDAATINELNTMIELAGTALDAAKDARKAADVAAFEEYKESVKTLADGMKKEGDSDACIALIEATKEAVDAVTYDENKTLDENKEALDAAAALTQLAADLADQRAAEADDPQEAFEAYRETLLTLAQALRKEGDSAAVTALIDEAVAALTGFAYDGAKTLAENEDALAEVLALFAGSVKSQRQAERQEALNHEPCSLCGEHHTGSLLENFIGVIHGVIWIMRSIVLIAA